MTEIPEEMTHDSLSIARRWLSALERGDRAALRGVYTADAVLHTDAGDFDSPEAIVDHLMTIAPTAAGLSVVEPLDATVTRARWATRDGRELHVNIRVTQSGVAEQWLVEHEDFAHPDLHRRGTDPKS
jgi:hypothetical protein